MIHPDCKVEFINTSVNRGVVATKLIPKGTIVWIGDALDQHFTPDMVDSLPEFLQEYFYEYAYRDEKGDYILCWDESRFVNHSCEPNIVSCGFDFEIAARDIKPGEQVTGDYAGLKLTEPMPCLCGSSLCRGMVRPEDAYTLWQVWDEAAREPILAILRVDQPLWPLVHEKKLIKKICSGQAPIPSCRDYYLHGS